MESAWRWEILQKIVQLNIISFILREDRFLFSKSIPQEWYSNGNVKNVTKKENMEKPNIAFIMNTNNARGKKEYKLPPEKASKSFKKVGE